MNKQNKTIKIVHILAIFLIYSFLFAQNEYEPTAINPYGLPNQEAPSEINEYEPMIGLCDCVSTRIGADGTWSDPVNMTWEFKYIMNGLAVQDQTIKEDGSHAGSIRQFNPDSSKWYVHNYSSSNPSPTLGTWQGGKIGNDIILYKSQKAPNGMDGNYKITFKNITDDAFNWIGEWVNLDESIIFPTWEIDCIKRTKTKKY